MGTTIKINITLPGDDLIRIDEQVKEERTTRSGLILKALRFYIARKEEPEAEKMKRITIQNAVADIKKLRANPDNGMESPRSAIGETRYEGLCDRRKRRCQVVLAV